MEFIICCASYILVGVPNDGHHPVCGLPFIEFKSKPVAEPFNGGLPFERRQARLEHQLNRTDELISVRSDGQERFDGQLLEELIAL